jgi:hypothetical protein
MESGDAADVEQQAEEHGRVYPPVYVCVDERCGWESESYMKSSEHKQKTGHPMLVRR